MKGKMSIVSLLIVLMLTVLVFGQGGCKQEAKKEAKTEKETGAVGALKPGQVGFKEYPIGDAVEAEGISVAPIYFQSVDMEPKESASGSDETDIHLEADVKAIEGNKTGFGIEEFIPYITVKYEIKDSKGGVVAKGAMMPMNASDGPHYGVNVKMPAAGKYKLKYILESPEKQGYVLHSDKETGVEGRFWKKPVELEWDFNYIPVK